MGSNGLQLLVEHTDPNFGLIKIQTNSQRRTSNLITNIPEGSIVFSTSRPEAKQPAQFSHQDIQRILSGPSFSAEIDHLLDISSQAGSQKCMFCGRRHNTETYRNKQSSVYLLLNTHPQCIMQFAETCETAFKESLPTISAHMI